MHDIQFLPCTMLLIVTPDIIHTPLSVSDNEQEKYVIIDLKLQTNILGVLWLRKLRAHLTLYNKSLLGAINPGVHREHLKAASIPIVENESLTLQRVELGETSETHVVQPAQTTLTSTLVHHGHLRGGQSIQHVEGDVIILGNVHNGSEVVAGGHIHICGTLFGRALAGARLGHEAIISVFSLKAELISINGYYLSSDEITSSEKPVSIKLIKDEIIIQHN